MNQVKTRSIRSSMRIQGSRLGCLISLAACVLVAGPAGAEEPPEPVSEINQRLYEQLNGGAAGGRIETVSGQMYISEKNMDAATVSDALAAMLDQQQSGNTSVAVRRASRLNFEIHFKKNSADLTDESRKSLDELGEALGKDFLDHKFVLGGHTDLDGGDAVNGPLSQARAETARAYLVEKHAIAPDRLLAKGFGSEDPLREVEESPQDKLYNRRVDLRPMD